MENALRHPKNGPMVTQQVPTPQEPNGRLLTDFAAYVSFFTQPTTSKASMGSSSGPLGHREPGVVEARRKGARELAPEHPA